MATTIEENAIQTDESLSERLLKAYKRVSPKLRAQARFDFCQAHQIADQTFRAKRSGKAVVTEGECVFMEAYNPHTYRGSATLISHP